MLIVVHGIFVPNGPVERINIVDVVALTAVVQHHDLLGLIGRERARYGLGAVNLQVTCADTKCVRNREIAQVSCAQLHIAPLVDGVDTDPRILAISGRGLTGGEHSDADQEFLQQVPGNFLARQHA